MTPRIAFTLMVLGLGATAGAVVPALGIWRALTHPAIAAAVQTRSDSGRGRTALAPVDLANVRVTPALRGEVVLTVMFAPGERSQALPLAYRLSDSAGRALVERTVTVSGPPTVSTDEPAATSLALGRFTPPPDGIVDVHIEVPPDVARPVQVEALRVEVRHELKDHTFAAIIAAVMATGGIIAATVGLAGFVTRRRPGAAAAPVSSGVLRSAMACHLAGFAGYVLPFGNVLAPLVVWLWVRERDVHVDQHGREALNFQLTMLVYLLLVAPLVLAFVGLLMLPLLLTFHVGMMIQAARRAAAGRPFRYPASIRFIH